MIVLIFSAMVVIAAADDVCICPANYRPVCGSDGQTYPNSCSAGCAKVNVLYQGKCNCVCPFIWRPVCGEDGTTYANECEARCKDVTRFGQGECGKRDQNPRVSAFRASRSDADADEDPVAKPTCVCTQHYNPVCGSNGKTYGNACGANCAGVIFTHGACPPRAQQHESDAPPKLCGCQQNYQPVCGSDGKTYDNKCKATCAGLTSTSGACPPRAQQHESDAPPSAQQLPAASQTCACQQNYQPVCGSDRKTYDNECKATCAGATSTPGACPPRAQQHVIESDAPPRAQQLPARRRVATRQQGGRCVCNRLYDPVCGTNGVTYSNECIAGCRGATVASEGRCGAGDKVCPCDRRYSPVCGENGRTYPNECNAQCQSVRVAHTGPC